MALLSKQFWHHEKGNHNEDAYFLARDTDTGRIFVLHKWSYDQGTGFKADSAQIEIEIEVFLNHSGSAQDHLRKMIGNLVTETDREW